LNIGFGGEDGGGSYHSVYDSFAHYERFGDPGFAYGIALAKFCGRTTLRLANADQLPFEFSNFAETVSGYADEVTRLVDSMREETRTTNQTVTSGMLLAVQDPTETFIPPPAREPVPFLNFAPLQNAVVRLKGSAQKIQTGPSRSLTIERKRQLDQALFGTERLLIRPQGLPRRDWFRHQIYAPGFYTGYGVKTLPGIREAIEQRNWVEAQQQIEIAAQTLVRFAEALDRLAEIGP